MKRGRFTEEQIVGILKEHEAGRKIAELSREHGVSDATLYGWKSKYCGSGAFPFPSGDHSPIFLLNHQGICRSSA
jgi:putative transposase